MAAAVAQARSSPRNVGRISRNSSPMENKKVAIKAEDSIKKQSPVQSTASIPRSEPQAAPSQSISRADNQDTIASTTAETTQPLAPPPRPAQQTTGETPDYFSGLHNGTHFSLEPNPFEQSFGPASETPGKSLLPPVAALTSPALPGASSVSGYNWPNSLRSGPLSPAMLAGPAGSNDYFDNIARGGFPTPNESSLRSGLTPGGGGSMFPAPSPNSQAIFNQLQSGGATPSTLDFHRTAMNAAAARKNQQFQATSNPTEDQLNHVANMDPKLQQQGPNDPFAQHDATDAANGLYLLAQARDGTQPNNQYAMPQQNQPIQSKMPSQMNQSQEGSPNLAKRAARNASMGGSISSTHDMSGGGLSDTPSEQSRPNTRGKGKKGAAKGAATNGRRKADDTPQKGGNKRTKGNNSHPNVDPSLEPGDSDDDMDMKEELNENGKKMTDEEKRKNFLERNRVAALKCRQRKKQWLANLQAKVEIFSSENDALSAQVTALREEIVNLKTLLLAHKDCPVSQAQGIGGMVMNGIPNEFNPHANPYGMAMQNGQMQGQMQRRYAT